MTGRMRGGNDVNGSEAHINQVSSIKYQDVDRRVHSDLRGEVEERGCDSLLLHFCVSESIYSVVMVSISSCSHVEYSYTRHAFYAIPCRSLVAAARDDAAYGSRDC